MELFVTNQSPQDRKFRFSIALVFIALALIMTPSSPVSMGLLFTAGVLLFNAISGTCFIYRVFGINTCPAPVTE
ncbi:MAG: DUF2892 domain-containing protein [Euryarchaeota archaeon]|nr:DUF2892 domain-containing protein [Euryarchaeota archaeon]